MIVVETALNSIVAIRASVPEDGFTAQTLGTLREGSGVVINDEGLVLTIGYLITEAEEVWLTRKDGQVVAGHALAYDQQTGFGLVQSLGPLDLPAVKFASSAHARVGDPVTLADGTGTSVDATIVAKQEFAGYWEYLLDEAIFIAPAHPSWGGAPLFDDEGKLLGIGSLRLQMMQGEETADINLVVPVDLLKPIINELTTRGRIKQGNNPWIGAFCAEDNNRVVVMNVSPNGPADKAGLQPGDIIADVRDIEVHGLADFYRTLWATGPAGTEFPLRIIREGRDGWVRVKTADRADFLKKPQLQ